MRDEYEQKLFISFCNTNGFNLFLLRTTATVDFKLSNILKNVDLDYVRNMEFYDKEQKEMYEEHIHKSLLDKFNCIENVEKRLVVKPAYNDYDLSNLKIIVSLVNYVRENLKIKDYSSFPKFYADFLYKHNEIDEKRRDEMLKPPLPNCEICGKFRVEHRHMDVPYCGKEICKERIEKV